jgi:hemolysin activation/secretion protein
MVLVPGVGLGEDEDEGMARGPCGRAGWILLAAGSAFLTAGAANAQAQPAVQPVPPTREEIERPQPPAPDTGRPSLTVEGEIARGPCSLDRPEYQNIRFTPTDVVFDDLRGLPAEELRPAFSDFVGTEQPVSVICEIRDRAIAILRERGYIATVQVPEQRIADGTLRLRVVMAKLVGLRVRGNAGNAERLIAGYLDRLTHQEVFNRFEAERALLLASDLPGYSVRLTLRSAGTVPGEVVGDVTVQHISAVVDFTVQNLGSHALGPWGGLLRAEFYGLTGLGDRTSISLFSTSDWDEQHTLQLAHELRLGRDGLTIGGQFTYAWASPDLGNPAIDIGANTLFASVEASYPFIRRQSRTLRGALGLDIVDQDIKFGPTPINRDRLRVAYARLDFNAAALTDPDPRFNAAAPRWRINASAELRQGVDIFGATRPCGPAFVNCLAPGAVPPTRAEADPTATVMRASFSGEYRPMPKFTIAAGARVQYSAHPLLSFEEYSGGNYTIGRGYEPGAVLGDSGVGFQAELRYGRAYPRRADDLALEPYVFLDQAWVWNRDRVLAIRHDQLTSAGIGVRAAYGNLFRVDAQLAVPLQRTQSQSRRGDTRFLITLTTRLWPWSLR